MIIQKLIRLFCRVKEYKRCEEMLNEMKRNRNKDESKIKQLSRHYAILSREIAIDNNDKEILEREFETYIEKALIQFGEMLRLSGESDIQTVSLIVKYELI